MTEEIFKQGVEFIKVVGFPAFVCAWFMLKTDKRLDKLSDAVNKLAESMVKKQG